MSEGQTGPRQPPSVRKTLERRALSVTLALTGALPTSRARAQVRPAERTERFALSAHAALGLGGSMEYRSDPFWGTGATGFEEFQDLWLFGWQSSGKLRPTPGLGLRLSFVGLRYLSVGLGVELHSVAYRHGSTSHFTDVGLVLGGRYPLAVGAQGRLLTPYVAVPVGLSAMRSNAPARERFQTLGYHVSAVAGLEVEAVPGFGVYVEAGFLRRRLRGEQATAIEGASMRHTVIMSQAQVHLGLRAAR
jgi:hypothetical protein